MTTTYVHKQIVLHTADAQVESFGMPWTLQLLNILIDPNLLYLLFLAGIGGLVYEVFHPGRDPSGHDRRRLPDPGAVRVLAGADQLGGRRPDRARGVPAPAGRVRGQPRADRISGIVALCAGGLLLFRTPGSVMQTSPVLVIAIGATFGLLLAVVVVKVVDARHLPVSEYSGGAIAMIGQTAIVPGPHSTPRARS